MSDLSDLLDRPIAYHRVFVTLTGSVTAAVLLSQAVYWQKRAKQLDGWWYKTAEEWEEETGLTRHEQDTARRKCERYLKSTLRGIPARLFWKVDYQTLKADLSFEGGLSNDLTPENREASLPESGKPADRKAANINTRDYTETTTETRGGREGETKTPAPVIRENRVEQKLAEFRNKDRRRRSEKLKPFVDPEFDKWA